MFKYELLELIDDAIIFPAPPEFCHLDFDYDWYSKMMELPYYKDNFYKLTRDFFEKFEVKVFFKSNIGYDFSIDDSYLKLSIEHFLKCYDRLDDVTKLDFYNFLKIPYFKKAIFFSLDDSEVMHNFLNIFNDTENLINLDCLDLCLKQHIERQNTIIVTQLLRFKDKHFSKQ